MPIFCFEDAYFLIECGTTPAETGRIYFYGEDFYEAYDSLTQMLGSILECYTTGAFAVSLVDGFDLNEVIDEIAIIMIKNRWNPRRAELLAWV
jgi:hypothetical protein